MVGPTSKTLCRRCINVIRMFCVCWVYFAIEGLLLRLHELRGKLIDLL